MDILVVFFRLIIVSRKDEKGLMFWCWEIGVVKPRKSGIIHSFLGAEEFGAIIMRLVQNVNVLACGLWGEEDEP